MLTQELVDEFAETESRQKDSIEQLGSVLQRARIQAVAAMYCSHTEGDLIEVGCYAAGTSVLLAPIARQYGRKLICIDNWRPGTDYDLENIEVAFRKAMETFADCVEIWKADAHSPETVERIMSRRYAFAFSDDGHLYEDHLTELAALMPVTDGVICADDVYLPVVVDAVNDSCKRFGWRPLWGKGLREVWLVK